MQNQPTIQTNQPAPVPTPAQTPAAQPTPTPTPISPSYNNEPSKKNIIVCIVLSVVCLICVALTILSSFGAYYDYLITFMTISVLVPLALSGITAALGVFLLIYALVKNAPNRFCIIAGISIVTSIATLVIFRFFLLGRYA